MPRTALTARPASERQAPHGMMIRRLTASILNHGLATKWRRSREPGNHQDRRGRRPPVCPVARELEFSGCTPACRPRRALQIHLEPAVPPSVWTVGCGEYLTHACRSAEASHAHVDASFAASCERLGQLTLDTCCIHNFGMYKLDHGGAAWARLRQLQVRAVPCSRLQLAFDAKATGAAEPGGATRW